MTDHYERGRIAYQLQNYKLAEKEFRDALTRDPHSSSSHAMLAVTLHATGKKKQGLEEAKQAVSLEPNYSYAHYALSLCCESLNKTKEAIKAIDTAIALEPEGSYLYAQASEIQFSMGRHKEALATALQGLEHNSEHITCMLAASQAYLALNKLDLADGAAERALVLAPENHYAHMRKAETRLRMLKNREAFEHYREALRLRPSSEAARIGAITSLKAKNPLYYMLVLATLKTGRFRTSFWILLFSLGRVSGLSIVAIPVLAIVLFFANLQTFLLRFDADGKTLLSRRDVTRNNFFIGFVVFLAIIFLAGMFIPADKKVIEATKHEIILHNKHSN